MYDDDLFGMMSSYTTTETEKETSQDFADPQINSYSSKSPYVDDYSTSQNFEEEKSYGGSSVSEFEQTTTTNVPKMNTPTIKKQQQAVKLTKTREKLYFSPRLKIAAAVVVIIFATLVFATAWNFAKAGSLSAGFDSQQYEISQLTSSINKLTVEYNELTNQDMANGYVDKVEGVNSFTVSLENFYSEPEIEKLPSNWFNDVCEFFSSLFAA